MPKIRETPQRTRSRLERATPTVVSHSTSPFQGDIAPTQAVPAHLQGAKENYELSLVAEEVQRQKAIKAVEVVADTYTVTTDAVRYGHEMHRQQVAEIRRQTTDAKVREQTLDELAEVRDIFHNFLSDNLEVLGKSVIGIAKTDPMTQKPQPYEEVIALTPGERIRGVAKRTRQ